MARALPGPSFRADEALHPGGSVAQEGGQASPAASPGPGGNGAAAGSAVRRAGQGAEGPAGGSDEKPAPAERGGGAAAAAVHGGRGRPADALGTPPGDSRREAGDPG